MALPPNVSAQDFKSALDEFAKVVGPEWVLTSPQDLETYRDAYSPLKGEAEELVASAGVAPDTAEEVQAIMKIANKYGIPIYPVSTGKNLGYGGSAPRYSGSVVLDLKRMNRILQIDEHAGTVLVEPGVSYFDLYKYINDRGLKLWIDTPEPGWGSLIGNALDGGTGTSYGPYRDHFAAHCGMEVVLADGEMLRTGMGALPTQAGTWTQWRWGFGPWLDGLFRQSNMGVVTKMGFWLMPKPDAYRMGTVLLPRFADLEGLIEIKNYLEDTGNTQGHPLIVSPLVSSVGHLPGPLYFPVTANIPELEKEAQAKGGFWACMFQYYGSAKVIEAQWEYTKELYLKRFPDAKFVENHAFDLPIPTEEVIAKGINPVFLSIPSLTAFDLGNRSSTYPHPASGHMWFAPIIPRTGAAVLEVTRLVVEILKEHNIETSWFSPPVTYWPKAMVFQIGVPISDDPKKNAVLRQAFRQLIRECAARGFGEERTPPVFQDDVRSTYSFNDHILLRITEKIKDVLDPKGIISAGRYGIWPQHLRKKV